MEYYVLRQGQTVGPFTEAQIIDQLASGRFSPDDLGQAESARHWTPLRRLFGGARSDEINAAEVQEPASSAPEGFSTEGKRFLENTWNGVQDLLHRYPVESGIALTALGCAVLILSYLRIFIVGPFLIGALFCGGLAMLRGRVVIGLAICTTAVFAPAVIWSVFFWLSRIFGAGY